MLTAYTTISRYLDENYEKPQELRKYWAHLSDSISVPPGLYKRRGGQGRKQGDT